MQNVNKKGVFSSHVEDKDHRLDKKNAQRSVLFCQPGNLTKLLEVLAIQYPLSRQVGWFSLTFPLRNSYLPCDLSMSELRPSLIYDLGQLCPLLPVWYVQRTLFKSLQAPNTYRTICEIFIHTKSRFLPIDSHNKSQHCTQRHKHRLNLTRCWSLANYVWFRKDTNLMGPDQAISAPFATSPVLVCSGHQDERRTPAPILNNFIHFLSLRC